MIRTSESIVEALLIIFIILKFTADDGDGRLPGGGNHPKDGTKV
jgi:hypothetical protein